MTTRSDQYLLQEANLLGERIKWYLEQHQKLEALGIFSSGAIWAFISSLPWSQATRYVIWMPPAITAVLFIKSVVFTKTIGEAFQYLYELEQHFKLPDGKGWVHYFRARSSRYKRRWRTAFWALLFSANLLIAVFVPFEQILPSGPQNETGDTVPQSIHQPSDRKHMRSIP